MSWCYRRIEDCSQPVFALYTLAALGSMLYFFAFFGVAFVHQDVTEMAAHQHQAARGSRVSGGAAAAAGTARAPPNSDGSDADVVIVGAGTVGAALATVLARQGKRVTVIER